MNSMKHMLIILSKALLSSNTNQWFDFPLRQHMNNILLPECFQEELNEVGTLINNTEQPKRYGWCGSYNPEWGAKVLPSDVNEFRAYIDSMENDKDEHGYFDIDTTHGNSYLAYRFNDGIEARLCTSNGTWTYYLPGDSNRNNYTCPPKMTEYLYRRTEDLLQIDRDKAEQRAHDAQAKTLASMTMMLRTIRDLLVEADQFSKEQVFNKINCYSKVVWKQKYEGGDQLTVVVDPLYLTLSPNDELVAKNYNDDVVDPLHSGVRGTNKVMDTLANINENLSDMFTYPRVSDLKLTRPDYGYHPDTTFNLKVKCSDGSTVNKDICVWFKDVLTKEERDRLNRIRTEFNVVCHDFSMSDHQANMLRQLDAISTDYIYATGVNVNLTFSKVSGDSKCFNIVALRPDVPQFLAVIAKLCNVTWYNTHHYPEMYEEQTGGKVCGVGEHDYITGPYEHVVDLRLVKDAIFHLRDHTDLSEFTY